MLRTYWRLVFRPHLWRIVVIAALTFVSSTAEVAGIGLIVPVVGLMIGPEKSVASPVAVALQHVAALVGFSPRIEPAVFVGLLVGAALVVLKNVFVMMQTYWVSWLSVSVSNVVRAGLFGAYLHARFGEIVRRGRGPIYHDIQGTAVNLGTSIQRAAQLLHSAIYVVTMMGLMLYLSWWATLLVSGAVLVGIRCMRTALEDRSKRIGGRIHELNQQHAALLVDALDGVRVVKVHTKEVTAVDRLTLVQEQLLPLNLWGGVLRGVPAIFFEVSGILLVLLLVGLVFNFPSLGLTLPVLLAMIVGLRRLLPAASGLNTNLVDLSHFLRQVEVVDEVLNKLPREKYSGRPLPTGRLQTVKLEQVSFHYPERPDTRVLCGVDLVFHRGQVTALVGATGAGKTTIADLLVRLYEPVSGRILVDGTDLSEFDLVAWRQRIGYVGQDTFLFNATLRENIAVWDETIPIAQVEQAARASQLHEFVLTLPNGYNTVLGDRGVKLSGGQRQRVAIARAILQRPDILVLDEATSALDNLTERAVHEAISVLGNNAIVIVIAHRLNTVQDADQVVVLCNGRIVEQGTHEALLRARGEYWAMYQGDPVVSANIGAAAVPNAGQ